MTELQCIASFYELGYSVSIPYGENSRYDFIADIDGHLIRVQVKTSRFLDDEKSSFCFSCRSTRINSQGSIHKRYTKNEIDFFATYIEGKCYLVPVEECSRQKNLRFDSAKNMQMSGVNFAKDYELSTRINKFLEEVAEH